MQTGHGICATAHAPSDVVWGVPGSFGEIGWYPQLKSVHLTGGEPAQAGSIREIRSEDGTTIRERLEALTGHSVTYAFDGPAPFPVTHARVTATATASGSPGATCLSWQGEFEVEDAAAGRTVEHINTGAVWAALAGALARKAGRHLHPRRPRPIAREIGRITAPVQANARAGAQHSAHMSSNGGFHA